MIQIPDRDYLALLEERDNLRKALEKIWNAGHGINGSKILEINSWGLVILAGIALGYNPEGSVPQKEVS